MDLLGDPSDVCDRPPMDLLGDLPVPTTDVLFDCGNVLVGDLLLDNRTVDLSQPAVPLSKDIPKRGFVDIGPVVDLSGPSRSKDMDGSMRATSSTNMEGRNTMRREFAHSPANQEGCGWPTLSGVLKQFSGRFVVRTVVRHLPQATQVPRIAIETYSSFAKRHLRPWKEFLRIRPSRIVGVLKASRREGGLQAQFRRNILANTRRFCPNYIFIFVLTLLTFVMSSPFLMIALTAVGAGWSRALRSDSFENQPWTLQVGTLTVPLGRNVKSAVLTIPTLLFLHLFMGTLLWSAALTSGGFSVVHAAVMDRDDGEDLEEKHSCFEA